MLLLIGPGEHFENGTMEKAPIFNDGDGWECKVSWLTVGGKKLI